MTHLEEAVIEIDTAIRFLERAKRYLAIASPGPVSALVETKDARKQITFARKSIAAYVNEQRKAD